MSIRKIVCSILVFAAFFCTSATTQTIFDSIPAQSLFVLRVHNLEYTLASADQFLTGISPLPAGLSMMVRMQLATAVGDANLTGIDMRGEFALFVIPIDSTQPGSKFQKFFPVILFPADYDKLLAANPTVTKPDANGISTIGTQMKFPIARVDSSYGLLLPSRNYNDALAAVAALKTPSLANTPGFIPPDANDSIWVRANVQNIMKTYGPMINAGFDRILTPTNCKGEPTGMPVPEIMKLYVNMLRCGVAQTKDLTLAINFSADQTSIQTAITPLPGTNFDSILASVSTSAQPGHPLLSLLPGDSVFTFSYQPDKRMILYTREILLDNFAPALGPAFTSEKRAQTTLLVKKMLNNLDFIAASFGPSSTATPPFSFTSVSAIKDAKAFKEINEEFVRLFTEQFIKDFYAKMGISADFKFTPAVQTYEGTAIDQFSIFLKGTDPNSPVTAGIKQLYGDELVQKIAYVDGIELNAMGADANEAIKTLVDKAQATSTQTPQSIASALALLANEDHQFVGTLNFINLLKIAAKIPDEKLPFDRAAIAQTQSSSSIAFAGDVTTDAVKFKTVIPKTHIMEIKALAESVTKNQSKAPVQ